KCTYLAEPISTARIPGPAPATPATIPFFKPRRSLARRLRPVWAAAAVLLIAIFGGKELYSRGAHDHDQAVADAKKQVEQIDGQLVALQRTAEAEQRALVNQAKADTLRLFLVGAAHTSADA